MCLYPKLILNPKYRSNKKNGGNIPPVPDDRVKYVPIGCQNCMECRKQKAREWQVRILEDIKTHKNGKFITLTINNEQYAKLAEESQQEGYNRDNEIITLAIRRWLERWRKKHKRSVRHWLTTELGHQGTNNIHVHGIVWTDQNIQEIENTWEYGFVWKGKKHHQVNKNGQLITHYTNYVSPATVTYITKYVTKIDKEHTGYKPKIFTSPGIGHRYTTHNHDSKQNKFNGKQTVETYRTSTGHKIALPIYWRNKVYTEKEREQLWLNKLDKGDRYICGEKVNVLKGEDAYFKLLKWYQEKNIRLGYGTDQKDWAKIQYENQLRNIKHKERLQKAKIKFKRYRNLSKTSNANAQIGTIGTRLWVNTSKGLTEFKIQDWQPYRLSG